MTGTYFYRISQINEHQEQVIYDPAIYYLTVDVYYDSNHTLATSVIAYKDGSVEKTEDIHFSNSYQLTGSKQNIDKTKTQYTTQMQSYWFLCIAAFILLVILVIAYRRKENG